MTDQPPLWQQHMRKCTNFNGLMNDTCKAGVEYATVRDESVRPYGYPCWTDRPCSTTCDLATFPTEAEAHEYERKAYESARIFFEDITNNICPHCKKPMTKQQVGRCVYARPCGHRLYQGRI